MLNVDTEIVKEINFVGCLLDDGDAYELDEHSLLLRNIYELYELYPSLFSDVEEVGNDGKQVDMLSALVEDAGAVGETNSKKKKKKKKKKNTNMAQVEITHAEKCRCELLEKQLFQTHQKLKIANDRIENLQNSNLYRKDVNRLQEKVEELEKGKLEVMEELARVNKEKLNLTSEIEKLTVVKSELVAVLENQDRKIQTLTEDMRKLKEKSIAELDQERALTEVIDSNVAEMKSMREELDDRGERIRLLEENKQFLMDENTTLKNKNKIEVVSAVEKPVVATNSVVGVGAKGDTSVVEVEEEGDKVVETISAITVAVECTVERYDSLRAEFEEFKKQQKVFVQLQLEYLNNLSKNNSSMEQTQQQQQQISHQQPHIPPQPSLPPSLPPPPPLPPSVPPPPSLTVTPHSQFPPKQPTQQQNRFHSLQFINNNSEDTASRSWYKPVRPGFKSYSEITSGSKKSTVFSTSITKGIRPQVFNGEHYTQGKATFHRFHGGKAKHIRNQIETHLQEERPDAAIIQIGGNDLSTFRGEKPTPVVEIANSILDCALLCKQYDVKDVCISSVLPRKESYMKDTESRRKEVNEILKSLCDVHNFMFIDNDVGEEKIVYPYHMYDGVHLTDDASILLSRKFGRILNSLHGD